ncbi:GNAT family N-acetyltransferase [Limnoraphis robusta]|uniref:GNAT family N-acetyltransferase n=1 Tax=Limnoraphis robusta CCNP1315 TaxID=3110306 RepID=A0ABU5UB63_9CYAN|nr:GNAT family N-acetyltransferase [Limnoraphis robusta]MEA5523363.1 GNAT family N-acetyltransferase [Limnoraphis robusta CCNP1315]
MIETRPAKRGDVERIFSLIQELADFERLSHEFQGNVNDLEEHLFGTKPYLHAIVAELKSEVVGYALFFYNYSTFLTKPGIYLEDLYVLPHHRKKGIGKSLLSAVAQRGKEIGAGRFEWSVLDWNEQAIRFYKSMGAKILPDWRICRLSGDDLDNFWIL